MVESDSITLIMLENKISFIPQKSLDICCEFGHADDAYAWRKSTKEGDKDKDFLLQLRK